MRISDWSSDVCSSDLFDAFVHTQRRLGVGHVMPMAGDDVRRQQHVQGLAGDLLSAIAEQRLGRAVVDGDTEALRSEEHTSELQSLMRISYAVFCLKKKNDKVYIQNRHKNQAKHCTHHNTTSKRTQHRN